MCSKCACSFVYVSCVCVCSRCKGFHHWSTELRVERRGVKDCGMFWFLFQRPLSLIDVSHHPPTSTFTSCVFESADASWSWQEDTLTHTLKMVENSAHLRCTSILSSPEEIWVYLMLRSPHADRCPCWPAMRVITQHEDVAIICLQELHCSFFYWNLLWPNAWLSLLLFFFFFTTG